MTPLRTMEVVVGVVLVAASGLIVGYLVGLHQAPAAQNAPPSEEEKAPTARVRLAPARMGQIERTVTAFGTVVASPEDVETISVPFECRVRRVLAVVGQEVDSHTRLIDIEPSPDALLALSDAQNAQQAAQRNLAKVQERLSLKLATKSELSAVQEALALAQSKLQSLQGRHIETQQLSAGVSGLVNKVDVQEGQIVPSGGPLVEVVPLHRIRVKLGVEPSQAGDIKSGQAVHVTSVEAGAPKVEATVGMVTQQVNPSSRLVDVFVTLPSNAPLKLETFVRAAVVVGTRQGLLVPRSAVLPVDDHYARCSRCRRARPCGMRCKWACRPLATSRSFPGTLRAGSRWWSRARRNWRTTCRSRSRAASSEPAGPPASVPAGGEP